MNDSSAAKRRKLGEESVLRELLASSTSEKKLSYGTAGFRDNHSLLRGAMVRVGMLASLRSRSCEGKFVGVMVTASHNPESDNGAKVVDDDGGMLSQSWEPHAERLVNAHEVDEAMLAIGAMEESAKSEGSRVIIGRDTRPHSPQLAEMGRKGAEQIGATVFDIGQVTTPQLHFVVMQLNAEKSLVSPEQALRTYTDTLAGGFLSLLRTAASPGRFEVVLDGSNGIGTVQAWKLIERINSAQPNTISVDLRNRPSDGPVNENCGAEMVQKSQAPPANFDAVRDSGKMAASFDGDADRIVFHGFISPENWRLIDGDKIAALIAVFLLEEFSICSWATDFSFGVVQTAYANGASTAFLRSQGVKIVFAKTGVKYLHEKAHQFDCGVYFEANGHGTVLFSPALKERINIEYSATDGVSSRAATAVRRLHACTKVINQAVGDAMSGLLICLAILHLRKMSFEDWSNLYIDYPSKQLKVPVPNKGSIRCSEDEMRVETPSDLQVALDSAMQKVSLGRTFVRPSGTEDCVRIYAEAETQEAANKLADEATLAVRFFAV